MKFEKLIITLCIIGLVIVVILALIAKPRGSFTELYFNEHTELPSLLDYTTPLIASQQGPFLIVPNVSEGWQKLGKEANMMISSEPLNFADLNKSYNISFTVISHEAKKIKYLYNITSSILNQTGEFELGPNENITINFTAIPTKAEWRLNNTQSEHWHDILDITDNSWLAGGGNQWSTLNTVVNSENLKDLPVSNNIDWFGGILQTKLSFEELARKPYTKKYEYSTIENAKKTHSITDIMLSVDGDKIIVDVDKISIEYTSMMQKFQVNLITNPGTDEETSQEIHFWYQIRPIGAE